MSDRERGSEIVQFVVAVFVLLLLVFATLQLGGMTLTASRVSSDILRACRQMDVVGIEDAVDKGKFVESLILEGSNQLLAGNLRVDHVVCSTVRVSHGYLEAGQGPLSQRRDGMTVAFDLSYEVPSFIDMPGLVGQTLERHVECVRTGRSVVEVEVSNL